LLLSEIAATGNFVRIIELFPPAIPAPAINGSNRQPAEDARYDLGLRFDRIVESVQKFQNLADAFALPELKDEQRIHLNSVAVAYELRRRTGNAFIPTITLRDSNRQNLLGMITFAIFGGVENLLVVRGDPYPLNSVGSKRNCPPPKNVYDFNKVSDFVALIRRVETTLASKVRTCIISPINISSKSSDQRYLETLRAREFSGVDIFLAESFFEDVDTYIVKLRAVRKAGITRPILHSIFPLKSYDDAVMCSQKFGWNISAPELHNLKDGGVDYGLEMARKRYGGLLARKEEVQGVCVSSRGNFEFISEILR
jgi:5,10-methylenetetrahydrofolate reductase